MIPGGGLSHMGVLYNSPPVRQTLETLYQGADECSLEFGCFKIGYNSIIIINRRSDTDLGNMPSALRGGERAAVC